MTIKMVDWQRERVIASDGSIIPFSRFHKDSRDFRLGRTIRITNGMFVVCPST